MTTILNPMHQVTSKMQALDIKAATLESLPVELVLIILDYLLGPPGEFQAHRKDSSRKNFCRILNNFTKPAHTPLQSVASLAATSRRMYALVTPYLYKQNTKRDRSSALLLCAKRGNLRGLLSSIVFGADVNTDDHTGVYNCKEHCFDNKFARRSFRTPLTALHWAAYHGHEDAVEILLLNGADANRRGTIGRDRDGFDMNGRAQRMCYSQRGMFEYSNSERIKSYRRVRKRRGNGFVTVNGVPDMGANPLFFALKAGHYRDWSWEYPDSSYELVGVSRCDDETSGLIRQDGTGQRLRMVKMLVAAGASLVTRLEGGIHALHQACIYGDVEVVNFLLQETPTDPNVTDAVGNTALHLLAITQGQLKREQRLSSRLQHAVTLDEESLTAVIGLIVDAGGDISACNVDEGNSPLDWAVHFDDDLLVRCLEQRGARVGNNVWDQLTTLVPPS